MIIRLISESIGLNIVTKNDCVNVSTFHFTKHSEIKALSGYIMFFFHSHKLAKVSGGRKFQCEHAYMYNAPARG